jgi:hypothetical protein
MHQARRSGQQVISDVKQIVRVVVGKVELQQAKAVVGRLIEPELLNQQLNATDAPVGGGSRAIGDLVVDEGTLLTRWPAICPQKLWKWARLKR